MAKNKRAYICNNCDAHYPSWNGHCNRCGSWASIASAASAVQSASAGSAICRPLAEVVDTPDLPMPVGLDEFDRVLGGGLTPGSVTLLAGEPGIGKSTLTLQIASAVSGQGATVVLLAGEESPAQIALRGVRVGQIPPTLMVADSCDAEAVCALFADRPRLVIIDSIQTMSAAGCEAQPGSVSQVKASAALLIEAAKKFNVSLLIIGHVTKEGSIAGPRVLEHAVDTVLSFEGERHGELRMLRAVKHRFGPTNEVGFFEMGAAGLVGLADPSGRYLQDRRQDLAGSVIAPLLVGRRPVLSEVQAMVCSGPGHGSVSAQGLDRSRVGLVAAVLATRAGLKLADQDLFVSMAGGVKTAESGVDLALALALASAVGEVPVGPEVVAFGELGLGGEIRLVPQASDRLNEAYRLGFRRALVPGSVVESPTGLDLIRVSNLTEALVVLRDGAMVL